MYNGNYVAPVWINNMAPAINDSELLAMSQTIQGSQILRGAGAPTQYTSGVAGQRYADMNTTPPTIYRLVTAAEDANVWTEEKDANKNLALDYDPESTYDSGQYCIHEGNLYKANQDIDPAETWTAAHWDRAYLADDLASHEQDEQNPHNVTAAQTGAVSTDRVAPTEDPTGASQAYGVGEYLFLSGVLYKATVPINQGDTITVGTNVALALLGEDVASHNVIVGSITLSNTWTGSASPYSQTVTVTGATVTANSRVDLQPTAAQIASLISDGVTGLVIENNNGTLTAYAVGAATSAAMTVQCTVEETI